MRGRSSERRTPVRPALKLIIASFQTSSMRNCIDKSNNTQNSEEVSRLERAKRKSCQDQVSRELVSVVHYRDRNTSIVLWRPSFYFQISSIIILYSVKFGRNNSLLKYKIDDISDLLVNIFSSFCSEI